MLRTVTPLALLDSHKAFIVRGNASEIMAPRMYPSA